LPSVAQPLKAVGWERNRAGKLSPQTTDLGATMDPSRMAESVASLNLQLMRWRLVPDLNLDVVSKCRCLVLGAGTLGCFTARCLMVGIYDSNNSTIYNSWQLFIDTACAVLDVNDMIVCLSGSY
jgi:hypothetical protein